MRFIIAAGSESEARAWAHRHRVRPCDLLVVDAKSSAPAEELVEKAAAVPLYGVPVVRLVGWYLRASAGARLELEQFLADQRPPIVQVV